MLGTVLAIIGLYFLYTLIFRFILPIYRASKRMREQMREFQDRMQNENGYNSNGSSSASAGTANPQPQTTKAGDYIDFEEVK